MKNSVVILGTAHGSNVPGKCSPDKKFREYKFSREVIASLKPMLEKLGYLVFVDMPEDIVPQPSVTELSKRCKFVNNLVAKYGKERTIYVSIHVNAADHGQWMNARGFAVYVARTCSSNSKRLAQLLYAQADKHGLRGNRSVPKEKYWQANFYVLRNTACPAVLTENLFQDNREDVAFLMSPEGKDTIVKLHYDSIKQYFDSL